MKKLKQLMMICALLLAIAPAMAQRTFELNLWSHGAPVASQDPTDTAKVYVFLPEKSTGRAVLICPGGGYGSLAMAKEGTDWAGFLNNMGIAAIVLKYRMPHGVKEVAIGDAEEAMKLIRHNASHWKINRHDVGIMGFSAGGHLASTLATHSRGDAKPNFQILFYPVITMDPAFTHKGSHDNLLGKEASKKDERLYSNDLQVSRVTPRAWIALSDDDQVVVPANGVNYYMELYRHDVPASLHVYPSGGHGWGILPRFRFHNLLMLELEGWLRSF